MKLSYELSATDDLLTARSGLICLAELMQGIGFSDWVDDAFPVSGSNRGYRACVFVNALMLSLHNGASCLDDVNHLKTEKGLRQLLGVKQLPTPDALGDWLRRMGMTGVNAVTDINRRLLALTLGDCKKVTLDIDATLSASQHREAQWTYQQCRGYMPMVGHIAETGQVLASEFRAGNVPPAKDNLSFIKQCEAALPSGVSLSALRIDAAGYQVAIIDDCMDRHIPFAIRAKMSASLKRQINEQADENWQPLFDKRGVRVEDESICRIVHTMEQSRYAFSVVIQRQRIRGQQAIEFDDSTQGAGELIEQGNYRYRAIATNQESMSDSEIVHWYNQRAEHSENRIKELKHDFGAQRMPCKQFDASALYFSLCTLAYNLFVLLKKQLPTRFQRTRAKSIRWQLYAMAGKVVTHGRKLYLKVSAASYQMLNDVLTTIRQLAQAP